MSLLDADQWRSDSLAAHGMDVYHTGSGKVREEWLSRCREERALTSDLMNEVSGLSNLTASLKRVISNAGSPGVDGMDVGALKDRYIANHGNLISRLKTNSYRIDQVRGARIPKPKGGYRQLGIPTVKDRLVQQAIGQVLERYYDPTFSESSYGFRKGKGTKPCLKQACSCVGEGYRYIVDIDLAKFCDVDARQ